MDESITVTKSDPTKENTVLVTGGSGFIATHCILRLLENGYQVRTTIRTPERESDIRQKLRVGGIEAGDRLSFHLADLMSNAGWLEAAEGCSYVLHLASPFPLKVPKDEDDLIIPAREGTLRVLRASREAGVKRVVLTSSFAAIGYSSKPPDYLYSEKDWSDPESSGSSSYIKSKILAEKAAWDFIAREGSHLELSVINPVMVLGPVLGSIDSTSIQVVKKLMDGSLPGIPHLSYGIVDVRDVADLHLRAMIHPSAKEERFLAIAGEFMSTKQIADLLRKHLGEAARKVPTRVFSDWLVKLFAFFDPSVRQVIPELGKVKRATSEKARQFLGWNPRSNEEAILATAESLIKFDMVHP